MTGATTRARCGRPNGLQGDNVNSDEARRLNVELPDAGPPQDGYYDSSSTSTLDSDIHSSEDSVDDMLTRDIAIVEWDLLRLDSGC